MTTERVLIRKKLSDIPQAGAFFRRLTGIDPDAVPEKYGSSVHDAHETLLQRAQAVLLMRRLPILARDGDSVTLSEDVALSGVMPPKVLEKADECICFVGTLAGFSAESEDMMAEYFIDSWGSAYIEAAQAWLANEVQCALEAEGKQRTHLWCPGQHQFELANQTALFRLLQPQEVSLTRRLMMVPTKSVSGIMGIVPAGTEDMPLPCDFCRFRPTCPSRQGCAAL